MILEKMIALADGLKGSDISKEAYKKLSQFQIDFNLNELERELSDFVLSRELPNQLNLYNSFGQPPITLFNNGEIVVDLYFWLHADTSIHDHSFSGAFKVISGKSLHEVYKFKTLKSCSDEIELIDLEVLNSSELHLGEASEIKRGDQFVHKVVHLDSPTVTLCVRTVNDIDTKQWHYFPNGLRIRKIDSDLVMVKSLLYFDYLIIRNQKSAKKLLKNIITSSSESGLINFYERLSYDQMGMSEQSVNLFFNAVYNEFKDQEWFEVYQSYYDSLQY